MLFIYNACQELTANTHAEPRGKQLTSSSEFCSSHLNCPLSSVKTVRSVPQIVSERARDGACPVPSAFSSENSGFADIHVQYTCKNFSCAHHDQVCISRGDCRSLSSLAAPRWYAESRTAFKFKPESANLHSSHLISWERFAWRVLDDERYQVRLKGILELWNARRPVVQLSSCRVQVHIRATHAACADGSMGSGLGTRDSGGYEEVGSGVLVIRSKHNGSAAGASHSRSYYWRNHKQAGLQLISSFVAI